jgi:type IV pilus assembly protein PilO
MSKDRRILTYLGIGLLILLLSGGTYGYFGILSPLHERISFVDSEIKQQKSLLNKSENAVLDAPNSIDNTFSLQEEVPVIPLVDQLMLQFEKAEVLSDSLIMTMQFSDGEVDDEEELTQGDVEDRASEEENKEAPSVTSEEDTTTTIKAEQPPAPEVLPEGVKKITAEMSVVSKDYNGLLKFLRTIEELKRVTVIEGITFTGLSEIEMASVEVNPNQLKYEITIAAYYLPELTDYLEDLPSEDFPAPGGKENPLTGSEEEKEE